MQSKNGQSTATATISAKAPKRSFLAQFQRWEWMLVGLIIIDVVVNTQLSPYFFDARNLSRTSSDFMEIGIMMLPMVFIIITGNIDLSVASNMGMSASFMGLLHNMGVNVWVAALAGLILGTLGGLLNGVLVARIKLPSLVVTLGTYAFYRGIAYGFLGDQAARGYPEAFTYFGQGKVFDSLDPLFRGPLCGAWPSSLALCCTRPPLAAISMPWATTKKPPSIPACPWSRSS